MATVKVTQGILRGAKSQTENGFEYYEFLSVPYAKPPIGDLRFKSPQPPESWADERDATKCDRNNISCQVNLMAGTGVMGSEDCLYLNVYTPQLPSAGLNPLPVIVNIHGGGFVGGNGIIKSENGPDYLVEQNAVVVMINYRLSVFGFLSLDIPEAAGNMGLKDQVKALEWVRDNIGHFGGDKDNVTIMGLSAGSASVEYLILSPTAEGLFHKAILQSGSALNHWAINLEPLTLARELVKILNYTGSLDDSKAMHDFLLEVPESSIIMASAQAVAKCTSIRLFFGFVPTVERDYGNGDAFITTLPYKSFKEGKFSKVPVIRGFTDREGFLTKMMNATAMKNIVEQKLLVDSYPFGVDSNKKDQYNDRFLSAYLENESDVAFEKKCEGFFTDLDFAAGVWIAGKLQSKNVPVYMYQFGYSGNINYLKKVLGLFMPNMFSKTDLNEPGALHGDDYTYSIKYDAIQGADEDDLLVQKRVVSMWTNFAKFGKPVTDASELIEVDWPNFSEDSQIYLGIDKDLQLKTDYKPTEMAIFEELYDESFIH